MSKTRPPYPAQFRQQMIELVRRRQDPGGALARVRLLGPDDLQLGRAGGNGPR